MGIEILLTQSVQSHLFPLARDECLRLDSGNKPKQHNPMKYMCLCYAFRVWWWWWWHLNRVLESTEVFPFKRNMYHFSVVIENLNNDSKHIFTRQRHCLSVFYSCLNTSKLCLLQYTQWKQTVWASGGVVFHRPIWYACASQPTQTHLMAGWLAFLPHSVIMALLQASRLWSPHSVILLKGGTCLCQRHTFFTWPFSPGSNFNNYTSLGENVLRQQLQSTVAVGREK